MHEGTVWIWQAEKGSWHFVTIDGEAGEELSGTALMRKLEFGQRRGWGSLKVEVRMGETSWQTSVFPQKDAAGWLLPLKASVRKAEGIAEGDMIAVSITVL